MDSNSASSTGISRTEVEGLVRHWSEDHYAALRSTYNQLLGEKTGSYTVVDGFTLPDGIDLTKSLHYIAATITENDLDTMQWNSEPERSQTTKEDVLTLLTAAALQAYRRDYQSAKERFVSWYQAQLWSALEDVSEDERRDYLENPEASEISEANFILFSALSMIHATEPERASLLPPVLCNSIGEDSRENAELSYNMQSDNGKEVVILEVQIKEGEDRSGEHN